jgi:hypothetical protein
MDANRFDEATKTLATSTSRRALLRGAAGGGLAALLAAVGLGVAGPEGAEAHRRPGCHTAACRRHRRKHRKKNNTQNGTVITTGDTNVTLLGNGVSLATLPLGGALCDGTQLTAGLCRSGFCDVATNTCGECPTSRVCGHDDGLVGLVCCINGYVCGDLGCVLEGTA